MTGIDEGVRLRLVATHAKEDADVRVAFFEKKYERLRRAMLWFSLVGGAGWGMYFAEILSRR
jgi:hypothetical protein